uniref:RING-type E3 ubiquitin transferase n=1 Tax=Leersia perrieri TaxID=77586 RepID=A0A0D9VW31_9ORYZ
MGSILCCLADDGRAVCCFCLPWPAFNDAPRPHNSGSVGRQRADTRVAPDQGRINLTAPTHQDSMDTFRCPPRPLPYDDPRFSHHETEHHPLVGRHEKASTAFDKSSNFAESKDDDKRSNSAAAKDDDGSSVKQHSKGLDVGTAAALIDPFEYEDDCPICLEDYNYENPNITLQCNHNFHLSCIYEWMERSQACPVCAKVMLFHENA